jgi:toxin-antitoxin system PIN domain toxin
MILCDVNIYIYAARIDSPDHDRYQRWLEDVIERNEAFGVSDLVLSSFMRIVTKAGIFDIPSKVDEAIGFATALRERPNCVLISPGPRHWGIFVDLCRKVNAKGNLVPDAYLAALAIESGSEWISADRDYARFPGLRWRHPLDV